MGVERACEVSLQRNGLDVRMQLSVSRSQICAGQSHLVGAPTHPDSASLMRREQRAVPHRQRQHRLVFALERLDLG